MKVTAREQLRHEFVYLHGWLHTKALPLWLANGFHGAGKGFAENLDLKGEATTANRRGRVPPRQIYCFAEAGARGWKGSWTDAVRSGLDYYDRVYRLPSGYYGSLATCEGQLIDDSFELYNQAFALLAFCYTAKALPDTRENMSERASDLLTALRHDYSHGEGGFNEAVPPRLPLCSNPHMHLFEAALACEDQEGFDCNVWRRLADEIAHLCMDRFIDAKTGGLREFFDDKWIPYGGQQGRIMEPGHQFEWAWLLCRWAESRQNDVALAKAKGLFEIGESHGICANRRVAIMALLDDFSVHDPLARLWPQAEWVKSAMRLAVLSDGYERERYLVSALNAVTALRLFLDAPCAGVWRDKLTADSVFVQEPAPASSFYHILCAIYEFEDCLNELP
ncbi:MAG: AGE family epimerase/isomerase [Hoeflea sp.]|nr:AGE family epimerase/isomerase [Hoeflea sp.]